jgi:HK97 family phage prohead protease
MTFERRFVTAPANFEIRRADGKIGIRGYASVFDQVFHGEVVRQGFFDGPLARPDDVRLLLNHDGVPMARTKSKTLQLSVDDHGLFSEAPELDAANPTVQETASAMERGDIDQMSFGFTVASDGWARNEEGIIELLHCKQLWDVSIVTFPWYESTEVELAKALRALESGQLLTPEQREMLLKADVPPADVETDEQRAEREAAEAAEAERAATAMAERQRRLRLLAD